MNERVSRFDLTAQRTAEARSSLDPATALDLPRLLLSGLVFCLLFASILLAARAGHADYDRPGLYIGGGATYATDLWEDEIEDAIDIRVDIDEAFGANARGGFRLGSVVAIELQYEWLDNYDINVKNAGSKIDVTQQTLTANLKLHLPISRVHPYVLAGIGYQRFELGVKTFAGFGPSRQYDEISLAGRVGAGADVYLTQNAVIYGEAGVTMTDERINLPVGAGSLDHLYYLSVQLGLMYRF